MTPTPSVRYHMHVDIAGALKNWCDVNWKNCARDDAGNLMTPKEVRHHFIDLLAGGTRFIPMDPECNNFDQVKGCMGHPL